MSATTTDKIRNKGPSEGEGEHLFGAAFDGRIVGRFLERLAPYKKCICWALGAVVAYTLTQISIPLMIRAVIDSTVSTDNTAATIDLIALGFLGLVVLNMIAMYFQEVLVGQTAEHVLFDLRRAMYAHLQQLSMSFMDKTEVGRLMSRLQGDVGALQEFLESVVSALGDILLLVGIVAVLMWLDWQLGLLSLSVVAALFVVRIVWLPMARKAFLRARQTNSIVNGALAENVNGVRMVQESRREAVNFTRFEVKARDNLNAHLRGSKFTQVMTPIVDTLTGGAMAIVVVVGGAMVLDGALELGTMVAFIFYVQRFFDPIRSLTNQYSVMQRAMASGRRIFEVMDVPVELTDKPNAAALGGPAEKFEPSIAFRKVTFGYFPDQLVLHGIDFEVAPGETIALVGPTGSGKTSITSLLHRFYDVWDGSIEIGGQDVRDVTQASLGRHVGMVLQEPFLFTGTIYDNIKYCTEDAGPDDITAAASAVGAHDFITALPAGYGTKLEQRGANLSLGQRQLISFARALVADTEILVLDEATASIDSYTERHIQQALNQLLKGRTGLVIAHRLATIRGADRIIVLNQGRIVETGTHGELLANRGLYHRLCAMNYASFDDIPDNLIRQAENETG